MLFRFRVVVNGNGKIWYVNLVHPLSAHFTQISESCQGKTMFMFYLNCSGDCLFQMQLQEGSEDTGTGKHEAAQVTQGMCRSTLLNPDCSRVLIGRNQQ
jgi:hypothetical protein